ncbi:MAG: DUF3606 domain-containing protein, partial [Alphaproteobacteria bacterium]
ADQQRVDLCNPYDIRFWCQHWQVSQYDLEDAVMLVGPDVHAVALELGRSGRPADSTVRSRRRASSITSDAA